MNISFVPAIAAAACLFLAQTTDASITITAVESGGDVIFSSDGGTLDLGGLSLYDNDSVGPGLVALNSVLRIGATGDLAIDYYSGITGPSSFGTGISAPAADSGSGARYGIEGAFGDIVMPAGFLSGGLLGASSTTYAGTTFAGLGVTPGTYVWTWGDGDGLNGDTLTLTVVPEPATTGVIAGLGLAIFALLRKRRLT